MFLYVLLRFGGIFRYVFGYVLLCFSYVLRWFCYVLIMFQWGFVIFLAMFCCGFGLCFVMFLVMFW